MGKVHVLRPAAPPDRIEILEGRVRSYSKWVLSGGVAYETLCVARVGDGFWCSVRVLDKNSVDVFGDLDAVLTVLPPDLARRMTKLFALDEPTGEQLRAIFQ